MKALTIRALPIWQICYSDKRIENRSRFTHYRGMIVLHCSKGIGKRDLSELEYLCRKHKTPIEGMAGHAIGVATIEGCCDVDDTDSVWATGPYCWQLSDVRVFRPQDRVELTGKLGLWTVDAASEPRIQAAIDHAKVAHPVAYTAPPPVARTVRGGFSVEINYL